MYVQGAAFVNKFGLGEDKTHIPKTLIATKVRYVYVNVNICSFITEKDELYVCGTLKPSLGHFDRPITVEKFTLWGENVAKSSFSYYHSGYITNDGDCFMFGDNFDNCLLSSADSLLKPTFVMSEVQDISCYSDLDKRGWTGLVDYNNNLYIFGSIQGNQKNGSRLFENVTNFCLHKDAGIINKDNQVYISFNLQNDPKFSEIYNIVAKNVYCFEKTFLVIDIDNTLILIQEGNEPKIIAKNVESCSIGDDSEFVFITF